jgi:RNA polymerase II C-terminal domain phosphatase-like 3/4
MGPVDVIQFSEIEPEWDQRLRVAEHAEKNRTGREGVERRELYRFPHMSMWTKLRPGIWKFLARVYCSPEILGCCYVYWFFWGFFLFSELTHATLQASQLYELHVYTMGNKVYATEMAKLLDPTGKLFAGRVISKGDDGDGDDLLPKSKDLDGVLGMESSVIIIDDSARVWPHHSENLIVVERYKHHSRPFSTTNVF